MVDSVVSAVRWLGAVLLLAAAVQAGAQHDHSKGMQMPRGELGSSAGFDAAGVLWVVSKEGEHVVVRHSNDLGGTWSPSVPVNKQPEPVGADGDAFPKIAFGPKGDLYVTWTRPLSKPFTGLIRFTRSLDQGLTFSVPITVHTDLQEITHRFDALTVNGDGRVFIAWVDKRDGEAARMKGEKYSGAAMYFSVSDDRGATFRGDFKLAEHTCECCRIALLPRDDGSVVAFWRHVFEPNIRDHALARLEPDGTVTGFRRATFDNWRIDACPHHGGSLAADSTGRLHAVWFTQGPVRNGVFYGRLGQGEIDGLRRVGGEMAEHADLAISGERVGIVWKEFDGKRSHLRSMISTNGGTNWTERELGSTEGASDQPRLLVRAGKFYAFWNTRQSPLSVVAMP